MSELKSKRKGTHDSAAVGGRQLGNDRQGLVLGAAVRFDQRPCGRAEPRAVHWIAEQRWKRLLQVAVRLHLYGRTVRQEVDMVWLAAAERSMTRRRVWLRPTPAEGAAVSDSSGPR